MTVKTIESTSSINNSRLFKMESMVEDTKSSNNPAVALIPELSMPVLGRFSGIFAKLNSMSVNTRFYSEDFWRKVLARPSLAAALSSGSMIGIFEHPNVTKVWDDNGHATARHPQNGAFVVKRLWIDGSNVMGEGYLLNTPLGKLLATYFLAKDKTGAPLIQLSISARGYSKEDYFDANGVDQMNPNDYYLQSFDVVMSPGIKGALVKMESDESERVAELERLESYSRIVGYRFAELRSIEESLRKELDLKTI